MASFFDFFLNLPPLCVSGHKERLLVVVVVLLLLQEGLYVRRNPWSVVVETPGGYGAAKDGREEEEEMIKHSSDEKQGFGVVCLQPAST